MKNKIFTIPANSLNSGDVQVIDLFMEYAATDLDVGGSYNEILYPNQVIIRNTTGADLLYNTFRDTREYTQSLAYPEFYDMISLKKGDVLQNLQSLRIYKFAIKKDPEDSTVISTDLKIECINYIQHL